MGDHDDLRSEQVIEQQISVHLLPIAGIEHEHRPQPLTGASGGGDPGMVRLHGAFGDQRRGALLRRIGQQIFKLSGLVAAKSKSGQIIAFEVYPGRTGPERRFEPKRAVERRGVEHNGTRAMAANRKFPVTLLPLSGQRRCKLLVKPTGGAM